MQCRTKLNLHLVDKARTNEVNRGNERENFNLFLSVTADSRSYDDQMRYSPGAVHACRLRDLTGYFGIRAEYTQPRANFMKIT